jgi:hypothetical protein
MEGSGIPKRIAPLTDTKVRKSKPAEKDIKLFDGGGLFLLITPSGGKLWHFKYRFAGKEKKLSFGTYPEVSLADAREKRNAARKQVAAGIDPSESRKAMKATRGCSENSFEVVAREWHGEFVHTWSMVHADTKIDRLEKDVFPWMGERSIGEITPPELLRVLRRIESRGALDTAHRIRNHAVGFFVTPLQPEGQRGTRRPICGELCRRSSATTLPHRRGIKTGFSFQNQLLPSLTMETNTIRQNWRLL